jgi:hypothetical protein
MEVRIRREGYFEEEEDDTDDDDYEIPHVLCRPNFSVNGLGGPATINLPLTRESTTTTDLTNILTLMQAYESVIPTSLRTNEAAAEALVLAADSSSSSHEAVISRIAMKKFPMQDLTSSEFIFGKPVVPSIDSLTWAVLVCRLDTHPKSSAAYRICEAALVLSGEQFRDFIIDQNTSDLLLFNGAVTRWNVHAACSMSRPLEIDRNILDGSRGPEVRAVHLLSQSLRHIACTIRC